MRQEEKRGDEKRAEENHPALFLTSLQTQKQRLSELLAEKSP